MVVETLRKEGLGYKETMRRFEIGDNHIIKRWKRIYLEEGSVGLYIERRGHACAASGAQKGRKPKLSSSRRYKHRFYILTRDGSTSISSIKE